MIKNDKDEFMYNYQQMLLFFEITWQGIKSL